MGDLPYLRTVSLKVELSAGSDIRDVCLNMCELSRRIGCDIEARFNEVLVIARPWTDPIKLADEYRSEIKNDHPHKIAIVR